MSTSQRTHKLLAIFLAAGLTLSACGDDGTDIDTAGKGDRTDQVGDDATSPELDQRCMAPMSDDAAGAAESGAVGGSDGSDGDTVTSGVIEPDPGDGTVTILPAPVPVPDDCDDPIGDDCVEPQPEPLVEELNGTTITVPAMPEWVCEPCAEPPAVRDGDPQLGMPESLCDPCNDTIEIPVGEGEPPLGAPEVAPDIAPACIDPTVPPAPCDDMVAVPESTEPGGAGGAEPGDPGDGIAVGEEPACAAPDDPDGVVTSPPMPPIDPDQPVPDPSPTPVKPSDDVTDPRPIPFEKAEPSKDGRTITLSWWSGVEPCTVLAGVDVVETATTVTITLQEGSGLHGEEIACVAMAVYKSTTVTLDAPLGDRTIVDGAA